MKTKALFCLVFMLFPGMIFLYGQSLKDTAVVDYAIIDQTIHQKVNLYGAEQVLVVMDIDNTILTGDTDLGSDIWYQWQNKELDLLPADSQLLVKDCLYDEAIGLLYELGTTSLTDSRLPDYINAWQSGGITLFALTSRSPAYRAATERELHRNDIFLERSELKTIDGEELILDYKLERNLSYYHGIMMTTGMNKGNMLAHILGRSGRSFKAIIFIDDTRKNIDAVKNRYTRTEDLDITLFHYTKILTERLKNNNNVVLTPKQAEKMDQDWDALIHLLNTIFPERLAKSKCSLDLKN